MPEPRKHYPTDIPAPLSQIDEPTEDVFKEEKEAALKKLQFKGCLLIWIWLNIQFKCIRI